MSSEVNPDEGPRMSLRDWTNSSKPLDLDGYSKSSLAAGERAGLEQAMAGMDVG